MLYNSPTFLFYFLPVVLLIYLVIGKRLQNLFLLFSSLIFYIWGETIFFPVFFLSIAINFFVGNWIGSGQPNPLKVKRVFIIALVFNITLLVFFKLYSTYFSDLTKLLNLSVPSLVLEDFEKFNFLPLGISFYTFASISYLIDIYKRRSECESKFSNFALYLLLFPKVVAGPIVRYREIAAQLVNRVITSQKLAGGARRFIIGLSKKVLIADTLAPVTIRVFALPISDLTTGLAWLGILSYSIQIFFDFSGYTDMAIGLGQVLGYKFVENFNYPYISKSISEFWQRWHISLSRWFRDYVFFPLERKRISTSGLSQYINILIVFLLTGLWHGVTPTFIVWGLLHGLAISLEISPLGKWLKSTWIPLQHLYALTIIIIGWVLFRADNLAYAYGYLKSMLGFSKGSGIIPFTALPVVETHTWLALLLGGLLSFPIFPTLAQAFPNLKNSSKVVGGFRALRDILLLGLLLASIMGMAGSTYQAYIYLRF